MEEPELIYSGYDMELVHKFHGRYYHYLELPSLVAFIVVTGDWLFSRKPMTFTRACLIILLAVIMYTVRSTERQPVPFQIEFYNEYMIIYWEKKYYDRRLQRKEYEKYFYSDITNMSYVRDTNRINIYGKSEWTFWNYRKDGTIPDTPDVCKVVDSLTFLYAGDEYVDELLSRLKEFTGKEIAVS